MWTGLWIIGHECGHGAFVKSTRLNDLIGWIVHSFLLVPFFAWKITHARHHRYAGHMGKDVVYVPPTESQNKAYNENKRFEMLPLIEETPVVTAVQLIGRQLLGWQLYLWFNLTAGNKSAPARPKHRFCPNSSHFDPSSTLFLPSQRPLIMLSNLGLCITIVSLCFLGAHLECTTVALLYFMPYLWVHHWIGKHTSFGLLNLSLKCFNSRYNISSPYTPICPTLHGRDVDIHKWGALHDRSELWGYRTSFFPRYL